MSQIPKPSLIKDFGFVRSEARSGSSAETVTFTMPVDAGCFALVDFTCVWIEMTVARTLSGTSYIYTSVVVPGRECRRISCTSFTYCDHFLSQRRDGAPDDLEGQLRKPDLIGALV
ncbi:hypothetical protein HDF16_003436 [Granulicella aggregans]|uniref:Uncharacterized protein n=1 Tax=Granulicella aggregans TaxID=474949 RepID=A0A7W7ZF79_9BACT|nr:hypothetical protein [Granulicella aggregans]